MRSSPGTGSVKQVNGGKWRARLAYNKKVFDKSFETKSEADNYLDYIKKQHNINSKKGTVSTQVTEINSVDFSKPDTNDKIIQNQMMVHEVAKLSVAVTSVYYDVMKSDLSFNNKVTVFNIMKKHFPDFNLL